MKIATGGNKSNKVNKAATTKSKVQESSASQGKVAQEPVKGTDKVSRQKQVEVAKDFAREQLDEHVKFLKNGGIKNL